MTGDVVSYATQAGVNRRLFLGSKKVNNGTFYLEVGWLLLYYVDGGRTNKHIALCLYKKKQHTTKGNYSCGVFFMTGSGLSNTVEY